MHEDKVFANQTHQGVFQTVLSPGTLLGPGLRKEG